MFVGVWRQDSSVSINGNVDQVEDGDVGQEEVKERPPGAEEGAGDETVIK